MESNSSVLLGSIIEKAKEFQKNIYTCFIDYSKAFDCVDHNKLWEILKKIGIPDHLTYLLRNLYAGQEATVRTGHETMFKLFNLFHCSISSSNCSILTCIQGSQEAGQVI